MSERIKFPQNPEDMTKQMSGKVAGRRREDFVELEDDKTNEEISPKVTQPLKKARVENIYMPTSRKEGGETAESLRAYFEAFPLRPESGGVDYKNYLNAEHAVMRVKDQIFDAMSWIKGGVTFVDAVAKKRRENPEADISDEEKNRIHKEVMEKILAKMEELKYLFEFVEFPENCNEIYDVAGGAGDVAIALMLKAYIERRQINKATIVDPVSEFKQYAELVMNHMPFGKELKERVNFQEGTLQNLEIPSNTVVIAKHPCGDLADDLIERWLNSDSPELVIMTCCQGKAKNKPPRYGLTTDEWQNLCRKSDWTNSADTNKKQQGMDAMTELDTKRVEYLRQQGIKVDFHTTDKFAKGDVIIARRK